jgi:hypothetical protein
MKSEEIGIRGDNYDRMINQLDGLPDVTSTRPSTVDTITFLGTAQTWIVRTFRQRERGDTIFVQYIDAHGGHRFVIPPKVAEAIASQRDSATAKNRKKAGRASYETQVASGNDPKDRLARARALGKKGGTPKGKK